MKVTEAASLALHTTALLAGEPDRVMTTGELASALKVSENHLSKVLQRLTKAGLVRSTRGPKGGFTLNKNPDEVTLLNVYEAIEGPLEIKTCLFGRQVCNGSCILGGLLASVNTQVRDYLSTARLSSMHPMKEVLHA